MARTLATSHFLNSKLKTTPKSGDPRGLQQLIGQPAQVPADGLHVIPRLAERRNAAVAEHVAGAGVVGGQRVGDVAVEAFELRRQVADRVFHVLIDVEGIGDPELFRRAGHELPQELGTLSYELETPGICGDLLITIPSFVLHPLIFDPFPRLKWVRKDGTMQYNEFVGQVQHRAQLASSGKAVHAIHAVLQTLGERLYGAEADNLAAQLPAEIGFYLKQAQKREPLSAREFFARVTEREGVDYPDAVYHARAVMSVVIDAVSPGEIADMRAQLPDEFDPLFQWSGEGGEQRAA